MKKLLAALCAAAILTGCVGTSKSNRPLTAMGDAPEFSLKDLNGGEITSAQLKGKVVIIDFWATWCVPCRMEVPSYNTLSAQQKEKGVELVGVTFDSGSVDKVRAAVKELGILYPIAMANDDIDKDFGGTYGYPTTYLIGKDWKIYRKFTGALANKKEILERDIKVLLEKPVVAD